ncbi:MAG: hypothetical protein DMF59_16200 [Acidobacteria bacterium]|nr:MAG: hypothetical protein DMF59_16200 [Acidobacteriota bacterium]
MNPVGKPWRVNQSDTFRFQSPQRGYRSGSWKHEWNAIRAILETRLKRFLTIGPKHVAACRKCEDDRIDGKPYELLCGVVYTWRLRQIMPFNADDTGRMD